MSGRAEVEALFEKVGLVYRAARPKWGSPPAHLPLEVARPTHVVHVVHPTDEAQCWRLDLSVLDDDQARARMRHLRGWVDWGSKLFLYRADNLDERLCHMWGARED